MFVNAADAAVKVYANANATGEFDTKLAAGQWHVYLGGDNGKAVFHKTVTLGDRDTVDYKVVSR